MSEPTTAIVSSVVNFLNCPCTYFAPMIDDQPLVEAYQKAWQESKDLGGFIPVFVIPSETLLETLVMNSDESNEGEFYDFDSDCVDEYRKAMIEIDSSHGATALGDLINITQEVLADPGVFEDMINEQGGTVEPHDRLFTWWDYETNMTHHLILAKIPVEHAYEIFAYLPMGGWNACPSNEALIAISRLWEEKYGAVPAVVSGDSLEYQLESPVDESEAKDLAIKQYAFCPSLIEESDGITISSHAQALTKSTVWYFWWDQGAKLYYKQLLQSTKGYYLVDNSPLYWLIV